MRRLRVLILCTLLGACATGSSGGDDDDVAPDADINQPRPDANPNVPPDAGEIPDANEGPQPRTLTQSNATTITDAHTLNCNLFGAGTTATAENRYYRIFDLTALGIGGTYTATRVDFAIESVAATSGSATLQVKLHTLSVAPTGNTFALANLTQIYGQNVTLTPTTLSQQQVTLTTPVVVPAGSRLVVEIFQPDMTPLGNGNSVFLGSNALGETGATYVQAPDVDCGITTPTKMSAVVSPDPQVHLIMAVQGTTP